MSVVAMSAMDRIGRRMENLRGVASLAMKLPPTPLSNARQRRAGASLGSARTNLGRRSVIIGALEAIATETRQRRHALPIAGEVAGRAPAIHFRGPGAPGIARRRLRCRRHGHGCEAGNDK